MTEIDDTTLDLDDDLNGELDDGFCDDKDDVSELDAVMDRLTQKYIKSPRDSHLETAFRLLLKRAKICFRQTQKTQHIEGIAVAVLGDSGAGKSRSIDRLLASFPDPLLRNYGEPFGKVVRIIAPAPCTLKTLGRAILETLGYPLVADRKEHMIWAEVRKRLANLGTRILYIDEMQNVTSKANQIEAPRIRDTLKSLLNAPEHPICLLLAGVPELKVFLATDTQVRRRTRFVEFANLDDSDIPAIKGTIKALAESAGLTPDFRDELAQRLIHASLNAFGTAIEMTRDAIAIALEAGAKVLTREHFATMYALRTGNAAPANPFVADNWRQIDCRRVLLKDPYEHEETNENPGNSRKATTKKKAAKRS